MSVAERARIAFQQEGPLAFLKRSAKFAGRRVGVRADWLENHRGRLSEIVFRRCAGMVRHGPFAGMKLLKDASWGAGDQGSMLLGFYEKEVSESLLEVPECYKTFVDIGAGNGYYGVGLIRADKFSQALCFELTEYGRRTIRRLAALNAVVEKVTVFGAAEENFVDLIQDHGATLDECVFLIDIEGAEFSILSRDVFRNLKDSIIIIEQHDYFFEDGAQRPEGLVDAAQHTHKDHPHSPRSERPVPLRGTD